MNINDFSNKALVQAAERLTPQFRQAALDAGWPSELVMQMTVEEQDGDLYINYPPNIAGQVDDLEYGTPTTPPNAVIRIFMADHTDGTNDIFESAFEDIASRLGAFE
jgi:hypothetical protein